MKKLIVLTAIVFSASCLTGCSSHYSKKSIDEKQGLNEVYWKTNEKFPDYLKRIDQR